MVCADIWNQIEEIEKMKKNAKNSSVFQTLERIACARQKLAVKFHFGYLF